MMVAWLMLLLLQLEDISFMTTWFWSIEQQAKHWTGGKYSD